MKNKRRNLVFFLLGIILVIIISLGIATIIIRNKDAKDLEETISAVIWNNSLKENVDKGKSAEFFKKDKNNDYSFIEVINNIGKSFSEKDENKSKTKYYEAIYSNLISNQEGKEYKKLPRKKDEKWRSIEFNEDKKIKIKYTKTFNFLVFTYKFKKLEIV